MTVAKLVWGIITLSAMALPLRIGVNALYLIPGGVGGTEIYLRNLLVALAQIDAGNRYFIFLNAETAAAEPGLTPRAPNFEAVPCRVRAMNRPWRLVWEQLVLPAQSAARHVDVLLSPGFTSPLLAPARKVTVIHDLQHKRQPQNFGRVELLAWRAMVWLSAHFSREIITVSESSRRDIIETYRLPPGRVHVVRHGVEPALSGARGDRRLLAQAGIGEWPYVISISTIHPHKNWARWLDAYERLVSEGFPHHLVIAGLQGNYARELRRLIESKRLGDRVHPTGWIPRATLVSVLQHAQALVFPSTFEGFGMPVLEAMAAGVPVACSDIRPLREAADGAALFFDPASVASILGAVRRILTEAPLRSQLIGLGRESAANFTWTRAAEETLAVLRRALSRGSDE